jgi:hypothetical protein
MKKHIYAKNTTRPPECPFCGLYIERPAELTTRRMGEMPVGACSCGAVYAYDITGRNIGSAFIEALVFACDMDWDLAWNLFPEEDYLEQLVENYDGQSNLIVPEGFYEGRKIPGVLYFIRMHKDIQDVTRTSVEKKLSKAVPLTVSKSPSLQLPGDKQYSRGDIKTLVGTYRIDELMTIAEQDKRVLRDLQKLLYSADALIRYRAAEALGKTSFVIAKKEPGSVSKLLQALINAVSDTAASSWGALDAIGEIIAGSPDFFAGYLPTLYQLLEDKAARPKILRALTLTAETRPDLIRKALYRFMPYLDDPDPEARGYTAWLMGNLHAAEAVEILRKLKGDCAEVTIYFAGNFKNVSVGGLATEALRRISEEN